MLPVASSYNWGGVVGEHFVAATCVLKQSSLCFVNSFCLRLQGLAAGLKVPTLRRDQTLS